MDQALYKVTNLTRSIKKLICCGPSVEDIIKTANENGINGTTLVTNADGYEISTNIILQMLKDNSLMILNDNETWLPEPVTMNAINMCTINESENRNIVEVEESGQTYRALYQEATTESPIITSYATSSSSLSTVNYEFENIIQTPNKLDYLRILPPYIGTLLERKQQLGSHIHLFVRSIVQELRKSSETVSVSKFKSVCEDIGSLYPHTFYRKSFDNHFISTDTNWLANMMVNHNNYLNQLSNKSNVLKPDIPPKRKRISSALRNSCSNWQPKNYGDETPDNLKQKQKWLRAMINKLSVTAECEIKITEDMISCYPDIRLFLNNQNPVPTIAETVDAWPFLFKQNCLFDHFKELMGKPITVLTENFKLIKPKFYYWGTHHVKNKLFKTQFTNNFTDFDCLKAFAKYFGENLDQIICFFDIDCDLNSITSPTNTPWVAAIALSEDTDTNHIYHCFVEKKLVNSEAKNIMEAINTVVALYYVLNIKYDNSVSLTMEFIQRCLLNLYHKNVRGGKRHMNQISKVDKLIKKIENILIVEVKDLKV